MFFSKNTNNNNNNTPINAWKFIYFIIKKKIYKF